MVKVCVSYSHNDSDFVKKLIHDLDLSDIEVSFDKRLLAPGDSLLKIFGEICSSDILCCVLSTDSIFSNWVRRELGAAISREIENPDKFRVIPIIAPNQDWEEILAIIPADLRMSLEDKYFARFDIHTYEEEFKSLLRALSTRHNPEGIYAKVESPSSNNPFRRVRTEHFGEDLITLARSFTEPERVRYDNIVNITPTRIEGGRGSGKTMILKSLDPIVSVFRRGVNTFKEANLDYFGVYCRLSRGAFITQGAGIATDLSEDVATHIFSSEYYLQLINSLLDTLTSCSASNIIAISLEQEQEISDIIISELGIDTNSSENIDIVQLKRIIRGELHKIRVYIRRRTLGETTRYEGCFVENDQLKEICRTIVGLIPDLNNTTIYFLLDEYENLFPFQKKVVNNMVKWAKKGEYSIKLAVKKTGFQDPQTLEGQEIQQGNDYRYVDMDYDISNQDSRNSFKRLLSETCRKILKNENIEVTDIEKFLEEGDRNNGFTDEEIDKEIIRMINSMDKMKEKSISDFANADERNNYRNRLKNAAIFRLLYPAKGKRGKRQYAGFDDFVMLSSGIFRYFLELCSMSYYFQSQESEGKATTISTKAQDDAAYALSAHYLNTISSNISDVGVEVQQLIQDLGDIFHNRLLSSLSEPEAARISLNDPQTLNEVSFPIKHLSEILDKAEMNSVFQVPGGIGGMRPKQRTNVQPMDYIPNRIFAPILRYSPYTRWKVAVNCSDLLGLIDPERRSHTRQRLIQRVASHDSAQSTLLGYQNNVGSANES